MIGDIHYNSTNSKGCNKEHAFFDEHAESNNFDDNNQHKFVLLERGDCHFVTKVRNVALNGGDLAIIIDTHEEDIRGVIMGDDGTGAGIRIPSVSIGNTDGLVLKNWLKTASAEDIKKVKFNINFTPPQKGNVINIELFYT